VSTLHAREGKDARIALEVLSQSRRAVEPALREAVSSLPPSMSDIAEYHFGWRDEHGNPVPGEAGKALRPALTLAAARAVGADDTAAIPAAVAVELVHNFSLLHDDVMDRDHTRRHRRTVWSLFGAGPAILTGDALLSAATEVLIGSGSQDSAHGLRMLHGAVVNLLDGQCVDLAFERRTEVDVAECERMAAHKTGALLACACALGALFGRGNAEQIGKLHEFGAHLGLAFQFVDDLLGIWGDPAITGKPVYSDLRNRRKTLPVVAALASDTAAGRQLSELYQQESPPSDDDLTRAAELIDKAGARDWCQVRADDLLASALGRLRLLSQPDVIPPQRRRAAIAELAALARLATHRDR